MREETMGGQDDAPNVKHLNQILQEDAQSLEAKEGGMRGHYSR